MKLIDGKYEILKKLGEGFGGAVYLVQANGKQVALKQLHMRSSHELLSLEEILDNFKQEFTTLIKLNHPHILRILDFGFDSKENFYYFTTEYIEGVNIFEATRNSPPEEIEDLFVQILRALSYLHSQRIYHLDIKPLNILVENSPTGQKVAKLIDFGLTAFRKKGFLAGTPSYIAPEALLEDPLDGRADLYSLGVTWYTCLAGKNPFESKDIKETITLQKVWTPPPLSKPGGNISPYLDPILEKLLRKNPAVRYHRPDQVIRDINWAGSKHYPLETDATALAYLPGEGQLVGREKEWSQLKSFFERVFVTHSDSKFGVVISGPPGTGKSRLLKELRYYSQLHDVPVYEKEFLQKNLTQDSVVLIDNADENLFASVERWMQLFQPFSVLIVLTSSNPRPTLGIWHHITLSNFVRDDVAKYIGSVLGLSTPPAPLVEGLYTRSEGNPLFLTELLQSLIKSRQLFDEQGRWSFSLLHDVGIDFSKMQVPHTLTEFCQNKYEQLSPQARRMFLTVSLARAPLTILDLKRLGFDQNSEDWRVLQKENLIAMDPSGDIRLLNPNFQDWVPSNEDPQTITSLHQRLGELFQSEESRKEAGWFHLGFGTENSHDRFKALLQFGNSLLTQNRWLDAIKGMEAALELAKDAPEQVEVRLCLIRPLFRSGQTNHALKILEETNLILKKERENPNQWRWVQQTLREMGNIYIKEGKLDLAHESLQASRVLLEQHEDDPSEEMILDNFKASLLMREGKLNEAASISQKSYDLWNSWPLENKSRVLNSELPYIYLAQGKLAEAKELFFNYHQFFAQIGNLQKESYALYGLALCSFSLKEFEAATHICEKCGELCRKTNNKELLFHVFNELGNMAYEQKDWSKASEEYRHALELAQYLSDIHSSIGIAINLALVLHRQGDSSGAGLYLKHVIETLETQPSLSLFQLQFFIQGYLTLGKLMVEDLKWIEARDAFRDAMHLVRSHAALERFRFSALIGLVQSEISLKRGEEAEKVLAELSKISLAPQEKEEVEKYKSLFERSMKIAI